jgi:DNA replication and repair protein RecF
VSQQKTETGVWLQRLLVSQFRCYAEAELRLAAAPVVLTGPNGAGKTNLLEAISFLSPGRGLRRARLSEIDRRRPAAAGPRDALAQSA